MKYKDYSSDIWDKINKATDQALKEDSTPVAAFDADGTLWDTDLGETFFRYQIENQLVNLPMDPWNYYQDMKAKNPEQAYLWLAQICSGKPISLIHDWAQTAVQKASPLPIFSEQKKIIELFQSKGIKIYIITASVKWSVEPGAEALGLTKENVIGVETRVENGCITDIQSGTITYRAGKVKALLEKTGGKKPFFASGNTMGDFQLLESATLLQLAVSAAPENEKLFKTEQELCTLANQRGWLTHRF